MAESKVVVLTEEQAEAFEALKETWADCSEAEMRGILIGEKLGPNDWHSDRFEAANSIEDDDFIHALYHGYETDKPLERKLSTVIFSMYQESYVQYFEAPGGTREEAYHDGYNDAVKAVADKLGIKVAGVND